MNVLFSICENNEIVIISIFKSFSSNICFTFSVSLFDPFPFFNSIKFSLGNSVNSFCQEAIFLFNDFIMCGRSWSKVSIKIRHGTIVIQTNGLIYKFPWWIILIDKTWLFVLIIWFEVLVDSFKTDHQVSQLFRKDKRFAISFDT
mgnify:CR=1 FL=1